MSAGTRVKAVRADMYLTSITGFPSVTQAENSNDILVAVSAFFRQMTKRGLEMQALQDMRGCLIACTRQWGITSRVSRLQHPRHYR